MTWKGNFATSCLRKVDKIGWNLRGITRYEIWGAQPLSNELRAEELTKYRYIEKGKDVNWGRWFENYNYQVKYIERTKIEMLNFEIVAC